MKEKCADYLPLSLEWHMQVSIRVTQSLIRRVKEEGKVCWLSSLSTGLKMKGSVRVTSYPYQQGWRQREAYKSYYLPLSTVWKVKGRENGLQPYLIRVTTYPYQQCGRWREERMDSSHICSGSSRWRHRRCCSSTPASVLRSYFISSWKDSKEIYYNIFALQNVSYVPTKQKGRIKLKRWA